MDETTTTKAYRDIQPGEVFSIGETNLTKKIICNGTEKEILVIVNHICGKYFRETRSEAGPLFKFCPNEKFEIVGHIIGTKFPKQKTSTTDCRC
ncbi:MAG: hypothetical protein PHX25_02405 [Candidatus Pacebacteria bacterium]|nr:hypothetical protein [Candidatus Paceibacterota bacterium]